MLKLTIMLYKSNDGLTSIQLMSDLHVHTTFSHGKNDIEECVKVAIKKGIKKLGINDHGTAHTFFGIKENDIGAMRYEIDKLNQIYPEIEILFGIEANIIDSESGIDVKPEHLDKFDYISCGYHNGALNIKPLKSALFSVKTSFDHKRHHCSDAQIKKNTDMFIRALKNNKILFLTHPYDKMHLDLIKIAETCKEVGTCFELNNKRRIDPKLLETIADTGVDFVISSDAHRKEDIGDISKILKDVFKANISLGRIVNIEKVIA